jgi:hypothetical protein
MAKLFLKIDQRLRIVIPPLKGGLDKSTVDYFHNQMGSQTPEIEINFSLLPKSVGSSCGFTITSTSIQEGEISIEHVSESTFDITLKSLLVKVDVYEMHLTSIEQKNTLVVSSVGIPRSGLALSAQPQSDSNNNHSIKWGDENYLIASFVSLGSKKKALEPYLPRN